MADLKLNVPPSQPRTIQNEERGGGGEDVQWKHLPWYFLDLYPSYCSQFLGFSILLYFILDEIIVHTFTI